MGPCVLVSYLEMNGQSVFMQSSWSVTGLDGFGSSSISYFSSSTCSGSSILVSVLSSVNFGLLQSDVSSADTLDFMELFFYRALVPRSSSGVSFLQMLNSGPYCTGAFNGYPLAVNEVLETSSPYGVPSCPVLADFGPLKGSSDVCGSVYAMISSLPVNAVRGFDGYVTGRCTPAELPMSLSGGASAFVYPYSQGLILIFRFCIFEFGFGLL